MESSVRDQWFPIQLCLADLFSQALYHFHLDLPLSTRQTFPNSSWSLSKPFPIPKGWNLTMGGADRAFLSFQILSQGTTK